MGIFEMLEKNSPYETSMEKESQSSYLKLVDTNKELVDKNKELESKILNAVCYLRACIDTYEYLDIDSVLLHTYNLLNEKPLKKEEYATMISKENKDGQRKFN